MLTIEKVALQDNWRTLSQRAGKAACGAAMKRIAYGLGIGRAAQALQDAGCRSYFVVRPSPQKHFDQQEQMNRVNGVAEVIIGKQRHGPTGIVELQFEACLIKFQNLVCTDYLPERFE